MSDEPPPKKAKALFSFMPDTDTGGSFSQSQSQSSGAKEVGEYLLAGSVSMQINLLQFWKENEKKVSIVGKIGKGSSWSPILVIFSRTAF